MIAKISILTSVIHNHIDKMDSPITLKIGYWKSVEVDNIIIPFNQQLKTLTIRAIRKEIQCFHF